MTKPVSKQIRIFHRKNRKLNILTESISIFVECIILWNVLIIELDYSIVEHINDILQKKKEYMNILIESAIICYRMFQSAEESYLF